MPFAVSSYPYEDVRRETRRQFGEAHSGEVRQPGSFGWLAEPAEETGSSTAGLRSGPPRHGKPAVTGSCR